MALENQMSTVATTAPGFLNENGQQVVCLIAVPDTDHNQHIYALRCTNCGLHYGSNATDVLQRRCPACQDGVAGYHIPTFLLTWSDWEWPNLSLVAAETLAGGSYRQEWMIRAYKQVKAGHRVLLMKQGEEPRGLVASGYAASDPTNRPHRDGSGRLVPKIDVRFDTVLDPTEDALIPRLVLKKDFPSVRWDAEGSGYPIPSPDDCRAVELAWARHVHPIRKQTLEFSGWMQGEREPLITDPEGRRRLAVHYRYERSAANRAHAIEIHGFACKVCGFDFNLNYGADLARDFIEVHHTRPVSELSGDVPNIVSELLPVCANCHRMAHRDSSRIVPLDELRVRVGQRRSTNLGL